MRLAPSLMFVLSLGIVSGTALSAEQDSAVASNLPFFAFDNGTGRGDLEADVQAQMLKDLGYDGIGYTGTEKIPEMLAALDARGLKMFSTYVEAKVGPDGASYDPNLKQAIRQLKGRDTLIWLFIRRSQPSSEDLDDQTVRMVREIADLASKSGLRVALYPHTGFYVARTEDAIRIVKKVERDNVGVSFNLCHFLKLDDEQNMASLLKVAMPHLFVVSINGADRGDTKEMGWDRLIQTLDQGDFSQSELLKILKRLGYQGPVGLQCYAIKGDLRENLQRSLSAWRGLAGTAKTTETPLFRFEDQNETSICLYEGERPVLAYNYGVVTNDKVPQDDPRRSRACYIHPVWGLDGEVLTDDFPRDHYHHHGVFWTWPHVRMGEKEYDLWADRGIKQQFVRWIHRQTGPSAAVLAVENGWFVGEKKVMVERVRMQVHEASERSRAIDLDFVWMPEDEPVTLWGAAGKSYGGLTMRFAPRQDQTTLITVPEGPTTADLAETPLKWADWSARFEDRGNASGAAIFVHPSHPDFPPTWLTRHYGALCVGWPGVKSQTFETNRPIRASYRIWIHEGVATTEQLHRAYSGYATASIAEWQ